jgi:hypothetical protein
MKFPYLMIELVRWVNSERDRLTFIAAFDNALASHSWVGVMASAVLM